MRPGTRVATPSRAHVCCYAITTQRTRRPASPLPKCSRRCTARRPCLPLSTLQSPRGPICLRSLTTRSMRPPSTMPSRTWSSNTCPLSACRSSLTASTSGTLYAITGRLRIPPTEARLCAACYVSAWRPASSRSFGPTLARRSRPYRRCSRSVHTY